MNATTWNRYVPSQYADGRPPAMRIMDYSRVTFSRNTAVANVGSRISVNMGH